MPGWAHPRMSTIGQEQSVVVAESGRSTPELGEATAQHVGTASARTTSAFAEAISAAHTLQHTAGTHVAKRPERHEATSPKANGNTGACALDARATFSLFDLARLFHA